MSELGYIAKVKPGFSVRGRLEGVPGGAVAVIQMKDVSDSGCVMIDELLRLERGDVRERYWVEAGDLVFKSRGQANKAAVIPEGLGLVAINAPLYQVCVDRTVVLPEYLCWWINQLSSQVHFDRNVRGTAARMIGKDVLESLKVELPPLETQQMIVELAGLAERERNVMHNLAKKKNERISEILMQLVSGRARCIEDKSLPEMLKPSQEGCDKQNNNRESH